MPALRTTSARRVAVGLAVLAGIASLFALVGVAGARRRGLPRIPKCFYTGSGFGSCQGEIIPAGGSVLAVKYPNYGANQYWLQGPAPLQFTKPVVGSLYNHLDWYLGLGLKARSGCQTNESWCVVNVPPQSTRWVPVYVRQNNDPKKLWALWNPRACAVVLRQGKGDRIPLSRGLNVCMDATLATPTPTPWAPSRR